LKFERVVSHIAFSHFCSHLLLF